VEGGTRGNTGRRGEKIIEAEVVERVRVRGGRLPKCIASKGKKVCGRGRAGG